MFSGSGASSDGPLLMSNSFTLPENLLAFVLLFQFNSPHLQIPSPLKAYPFHDTFPWGFSPDLFLAVSNSAPTPVPQH